MARGDVVSDYDNQVADGNFLTVQPTSGDVWMVTHIIVEGTTAVQVMQSADGAACEFGAFGGVATGDASWTGVGIRLLHYIIDNSNYIRVKCLGGTINLGYSAVKIKE